MAALALGDLEISFDSTVSILAKGKHDCAIWMDIQESPVITIITKTCPCNKQKFFSFKN